MRVSNCTEFETHLNASIENRTRPNEIALAAHAEDCADCRQRLDDDMLLDQAISVWTAELPEVDLVDAVLAEHAFSEPYNSSAEPCVPATAGIKSKRSAAGSNGHAGKADVYLHPLTHSDKAPTTADRSRGTFAVLAAAAMILLIVANPFGRPPADLPPTENVVATIETPRPVSTDPPPPEADVETIVRDAGTAYIELARGAADIFTDGVVLVPEPVIPRSAAEAGTNEADGIAPWGQELDPIRRDVGHAIDFLFNTVAGEGEPAI